MLSQHEAMNHIRARDRGLQGQQLLGPTPAVLSLQVKAEEEAKAQS